MSTIVTRSGKGSILSTADMDNNLTNLNNDKIEVATIHNATEKTTPVNDDEFAIVDSAASYILKKFKWSSLVTAVTSALSTVYATFAQGAKADTALQPAAIGTTVLGYVAPGTAGNVLTDNGTAWVSAAPVGMKLIGTTATTSGTAFDFTGIAQGSRVTIVAKAVSLSGTDNILIQVGTDGTFITTGYDSQSNIIAAGSVSVATSGSIGILQRLASSAYAMTGTLSISNIDSSVSVCSGVSKMETGVLSITSGSIPSGNFNSIRITRTGTNTFDGGTITVYAG